MPVLFKVWSAWRRRLGALSWGFILAAFAMHLLASASLMAMAGEDHLLKDAWVWCYYYITTASSVGYGDLSPQSSLGRGLAAFFVIPGAIGLFATVLGKVTTAFINAWRKQKMGSGDYSKLKGHTVIVGWNGNETLRLVALLGQDVRTDDEGIVLVDATLEETPFAQGQAQFVNIASLADPQAYGRAGLAGAARIIVDASTDEQTLAAAFAVLASRPSGQVVVNFDQAGTAKLLQTHHPEVECVLPIQVELMVRAAQDSGASRVIADLVSPNTGMVQFSMTLPKTCQPWTFGALSALFKERFDALAVGMAQDARQPRLNPPSSQEVRGGDIVYYIAAQRLDDAALAKACTKA